jgi:uncharacterized protein Smg (DUF494 family)
MNEKRTDDAVGRLLRLFAERLECYLDGDELAFETMGELIEEGQFSADEVQSALWVLRGLGNESAAGGEASVDNAPGKHAQRVLSAEERESVSPEAWGYLIDLNRRGALNSEQVERVLDLLVGSGVRPVDVDLAREVASRVALEGNSSDRGEIVHGDFDLIH